MKTVMKATRILGTGGSDTWNTDDGVTIHEDRFGMTACGVTIGTRSRGWLKDEARGLDVTCKRCLRRLA